MSPCNKFRLIFGSVINVDTSCYNLKKNKENNKIFYPSKRLAQDGEDTGSFRIKEMENFLSHHKEMVNSNYLVKY